MVSHICCPLFPNFSRNDLEFASFKIAVVKAVISRGSIRYPVSSDIQTSLAPSISKLKKNGLKIDGPLISDTLFIKNFKKYNVVVGMYHDQVLTPFKTLYQFDAINITLGLKYLRVSPDHGTAVDIIRKNSANYHSLFKCIKFLNNLRK